ncbi:hypothetical protein CAPTEDRAFT_217830 [Capitella teleta]|uniref:Uncharacterized protein n=1 Tax=Capitella teleta TaxID=283909 RepID=R7VLL5_CAPTE|nr:hypothetical protein CAPTEDRAFT_217830 [Capitella teleta]|eukprot:ELU17690.1 hypothetical protein CAPTEDRAFT_217830 [Capitella teleta]
MLQDYKEGKAFSYHKSKWMKKVYINLINDDSKVCFLKAACTPSMNVTSTAHQVWVAIIKETEAIYSACCSCFAGPGDSLHQESMHICRMCLESSTQASSVSITSAHKRHAFLKTRHSKFKQGINSSKGAARKLFGPIQKEDKGSPQGLLATMSKKAPTSVFLRVHPDTAGAYTSRAEPQNIPPASLPPNIIESASSPRLRTEALLKTTEHPMLLIERPEDVFGSKKNDISFAFVELEHVPCHPLLEDKHISR